MAVNRSLATRDEPLAPVLTHWSPFREIERMRREMDALFNSLLDFPAVLPGLGQWLSTPAETMQPRIEYKENENDVQLFAAVPGLSEKELNVTVTGDLISISGEKREEKKAEEGKEEAASSFHRSYQGTFRLPPYVEAKQAKAKYRNGILEIIIPKKSEAKAKPIKIEVEEG